MKKQGLIAGFALAAAMAVGAAAFAADTAPRIGDKVADGTVYASVSPDTHKPFYTTPADAPGTYTFEAAAKYCRALDASGHKDWRVPTMGELDTEFNHRAAIGGFNETGSDPAGWYWSSSPDDNLIAWEQRFSDGLQLNYFRNYGSSLRCVRG
jgi:hypothetical protein